MSGPQIYNWELPASTTFKVRRLNEIIMSEFKQREGLGIKFWGSPKPRGQGEEGQSEKETKGKASEAGERRKREQRPGSRRIQCVTQKGRLYYEHANTADRSK